MTDMNAVSSAAASCIGACIRAHVRLGDIVQVYGHATGRAGRFEQGVRCYHD